MQTTKTQNHQIQLGYYSITNTHNIFLFILIHKNNKKQIRLKMEKKIKNDYLVSSSNSSEVGHVGNGPHRESLMNQSVVDKHVGHSEHRYSKALLQHHNNAIF